MKTAAQLRIELANSQRTAKGREKWLEMAERINKIDCWAEKTSHEDAVIGSVVKWTDAVYKGDSVHLSMKEGKAFAFGSQGTTMLVIYRGKVKKINLPKKEGE